MSIFIGFLTFILVILSLFVILLVLVQLPKKETGGGMAFGAGMSDMLLGAGSGNVLTGITKYTVIAFLSLALILAIMVSSHARKSGLGVTRAIEEKARSSSSGPATQPGASDASAPVNLLQPLVSGTTGSTPAVVPIPLVTTTTVVNPTPPPPPAAAPATNPPGGN